MGSKLPPAPSKPHQLRFCSKKTQTLYGKRRKSPTPCEKQVGHWGDRKSAREHKVAQYYRADMSRATCDVGGRGNDKQQQQPVQNTVASVSP
ncbi:hypothetical protein DPEC_G00358810 [Dallia pectoralis]|uniref:Uncharacterized protein n=1 Tax=Dallia pectoralis TaxID=75939 RepID=A0ACC2F0G4_DALPE|nr:hypothetical protein DPEC_G00358810 [Dallia pectoralis]